MTAAKRYLLLVLAVEAILIFGVIVVTLVLIATSYNGECGGIIVIPGFGNGSFPCSFPEHMVHYSQMALFFGLWIGLGFWWVSLPLLLLLIFAPVMAYRLGNRKAVIPSIVSAND